MGNRPSYSSPPSPTPPRPSAGLWPRVSDRKDRKRDGKRKKPVVVFVNGIIGAGKSTFVTEASKLLCELGVQCVPVLEPTQAWATMGYPGKLYANMSENAYAFQVLAVSTRRAALRNAMRDNEGRADVYLVDRSPNGDACFERVLHDDGYISVERHCEFIVWKDDWRDVLRGTDAEVVDVFLDTTPEVAMERLSGRDTSDVKSVTLEYEKRLYAAHKDMLRGLCGHDGAYFEVPGDTNFRDDRLTLMKALTRILPNGLGGLVGTSMDDETVRPYAQDTPYPNSSSSSPSSSASSTPSPSTCPSPRREVRATHGIVKSRSHTGVVGGDSMDRAHNGGHEDPRVTYNPVYSACPEPGVKKKRKGGRGGRNKGWDGDKTPPLGRDEHALDAPEDKPRLTLARSETMFNIQEINDYHAP